MARTKGAKGKKTLAKEKGMSLEEYLEYERKTTLERIVGAESINKILNPGLKTLKEQNKEKEENKEEIKKEIKKEPEPIKQELNLELTVEEENLKDTPIPEQATIKTEEEIIKIKTKKKKDKEVICCERCHKPITGNIPFKINLTYLTTVPAYHRQTPSDRVQLCNKCIDDLNYLIDKWLWDEGKGMPLKYGQTVMIN